MTENPNRKPPRLPPSEKLLNLFMGKISTQLIYVAAELGIADLLSKGAKTVEELATLTDSNEFFLYRILRALANLGIFKERANRKFALTPLSKPLRTDAPDSVRSYAIMFGSEWHNYAYSNLLKSVKKGEPAVDLTYGKGLFEYFKEEPDQLEIFNKGMTSLSRLEATLIRESYDFSKFKMITDIGGGHGYLISQILKSNSKLKGKLLELPEVLEGAKSTIEEMGLSNRCELIGGSFLEEVPDSGVYIMKTVLHDWSDEDAIKILKNIRKKIPADGKVLIVECVIPPLNEPHFGKLIDIEMMVLTPFGYERTEEEFRDILKKSGFQLTNIITMMSPHSIVEAEPI
ncbi:hypothetical protein LCGC14_1026300 [marine sediment metagenome]|uniref:Uncharacterized protein n=1 Tax=marine sediment metagenome TaxID=412755 RepID=A0A0F9R1U9_9ZZZZ